MAITTTSSYDLNDLLDSLQATTEDKETILYLFESVSYNIDAFLRTNYLDAINDEDLKCHVIRFCFEEKRWIRDRYSVYVFLRTNSVILQGVRKCQAYRLDGSIIPIPSGVYLFPNSSIWDSLMQFEYKSVKSVSELKENADISIRLSKGGDRYGIMTTDCRIFIPVICNSIEFSPYFGVTMVIDGALVLWGKLWPNDGTDSFSIYIPYDEQCNFGISGSPESLKILVCDKERTWGKSVVALEKFLNSVPAAYVTSYDHAINNICTRITSDVEYCGAGEMADEDIKLLVEEVERIIRKYVKIR